MLRRSRLAVFGVVVPGLALGLLVANLVSFGVRCGPPVSVEVVVQNPEYSTLAVGNTGVGFGTVANGANPLKATRLFQTLDEGATWTRLYDFPAGTRLTGISVLSSGTLIAHVNATDTFLTARPTVGIPGRSHSTSRLDTKC